MHFFFEKFKISQIIHGSLAVCILVDQIYDLFSTAVEFIFNVEDFHLGNSIKSSTYSDCSCSSADNDEAKRMLGIKEEPKKTDVKIELNGEEVTVSAEEKEEKE